MLVRPSARVSCPSAWHLRADQIAISQFGWGAMENWGLVTYRVSNLLSDEADETGEQRIATVVAHELAHMVGDLSSTSCVKLYYWESNA